MKPLLTLRQTRYLQDIAFDCKLFSKLHTNKRLHGYNCNRNRLVYFPRKKLKGHKSSCHFCAHVFMVGNYNLIPTTAITLWRYLSLKGIGRSYVLFTFISPIFPSTPSHKCLLM